MVMPSSVAQATLRIESGVRMLSEALAEIGRAPRTPALPQGSRTRKPRSKTRTTATPATSATPAAQARVRAGPRRRRREHELEGDDEGEDEERGREPERQPADEAERVDEDQREGRRHPARLRAARQRAQRREPGPRLPARQAPAASRPPQTMSASAEQAGHQARRGQRMHAAFLEPGHGPGASRATASPSSDEDDARQQVRGVAPRPVGRLLLRFGLAHRRAGYCLSLPTWSRSRRRSRSAG